MVMHALTHASGQEDKESWIFTNFLSGDHTGCLLWDVPLEVHNDCLHLPGNCCPLMRCPSLDFTSFLCEMLSSVHMKSSQEQRL